MRLGACIVGGGPAGMMCGLLLARAGVTVEVLEKHKDFLRDFRGDTIHPSTLEVLYELGYLDDFLKLPHQKISKLKVVYGKDQVVGANFSRLNIKCPYIVLMPQWDFLNFLAENAQRYPNFKLRMETEVNDLIFRQRRVVGVHAVQGEKAFAIEADLVIAADGRHSITREKAGLEVEDFGAPMDVLWMRIPRKPSHPTEPVGVFHAGRIQVMIYRGDYWQCGVVILKAHLDQVKKSGLPAFRRSLQDSASFLGNEVEALKSWDDIKLLTVKVDRLKRWDAPGLLCIGDAAHAMSPIGGVGINLAIQDAIAAAKILSEPLSQGKVYDKLIRQVQLRRMLPTQVTQRLQIMVQNRVIRPTLEKDKDLALPWIIRLLMNHTPLSSVTAKLIGIGIRPEHIKAKERLK